VQDRTTRRRALAAVLVALLVAGCGGARVGDGTVQPRGGRSGLQGTGTLEGRQVAVAQGLPDLVVGDCDPRDGADQDVCIITDTVDGRLFVLAFENPQVLVEGVTLAVADPGCGTPAACDAVTEVAVVSVKLDTDDPVIATGGSVRVTRVEPFTNYAGELTLQLPTGAFSGSFDVVPRPDED
jgi:hypothetical protein